MKKILLLTPIYPSDDLPKASTPIVHYFAKEWVKNGYELLVFHYIVNFPKWMFLLCSLFEKKITSIAGATVRTKQVDRKIYEKDGVKIIRIPLKKYMPHSRYSKKVINFAVSETKKYCNELGFFPDCIIGHWFNPQIEIISLLKSYFNVPSCLVLHDHGADLKTIFKKDADYLMSKIDILGYRSEAIKRGFESNFYYKKPSFFCYSGIPYEYLMDNKYKKREFNEISSVIFVGTLIKRKYPAEIIYALEEALSDKNYILTYIGSGDEEKTIKSITYKLRLKNKVNLCGRLPRKEVQQQLREHDIFVMISKQETFGLVYLEAMAAGCITIASRGEGFDGIIQDGVNGFLCEAGNWHELSRIITHICELSSGDLCKISEAAQKTALELTDEKAAFKYINSVEKLTKK